MTRRILRGTLVQLITLITRAIMLWSMFQEHETLITQWVTSVYAEMWNMVDRFLIL